MAEVRAVVEKTAYPFIMNLVCPARRNDLGHSQTHNQIAQYVLVQDIRITQNDGWRLGGNQYSNPISCANSVISRTNARFSA